MPKDLQKIAEELGIAQANSAQLEAITFDGSGPLLVLAGPGSGKTFVITHRIRYLTDRKGIAPEKLLVLTFTRDAAASMKDRYLRQQSVKQINVSQSVKQFGVSQSVKQFDVSQPVKQNHVSRAVNFGTFHSIFYHVLKQSLSFQDRQLLTDADKKNILLPVLRKLLPNLHEIQRNNLAIESMSTISYYKNSGNRAEAMRRIPLELHDCFDELYLAYEKKRRSLGKVDFDDMLTDCRRLLQERADVRSYWQNRFDSILIDEFQDMNPAQYEVIKLLSKEPYSIFAVGDDDQSIYGFRGADPSCMQTFAKEYQAKQITLKVNYRSKQDIVDASLKVISQNKERFMKSLESYDKNQQEKQIPCVTKSGFLTKEEEQEYIVNVCRAFLEKLQAGKVSPDAQTESPDHAKIPSGTRMALLFRTNRLMQRMALRLKQEGIPFAIREKLMDPCQSDTILDVMAYLKLAIGQGGADDLTRIINKPSRYVSREALSACRDAISKEALLYRSGETLSRSAVGCLEEESRQKSMAGCSDGGALNKGTVDCLGGDGVLKKLMTYYGPRDLRMMDRLRLFESQIHMLKGLSPYTAVQYVRRMIGYDRWVLEQYEDLQEKREECMGLLEWLVAETKKYSTIKELCDALCSEEGHARRERKPNALEEPAQISAQNGSIVLMTVHAAKGLEFDHVMMPHCNERVYPHGTMLDAAVVEEERRIFYVGMTRAKSRLELTYIKGTREHPEDVSRFLIPLIG